MYFFRFDGCSLCQRFHCLQYDASKRPYPAWLQNHRLNSFAWLVQQSTASRAPQEQKAGSKREPFWALQSTIASLWISTWPKTLWILLQRRIWQKNLRQMHWVWCIFVSCKWTKLFSKTSFLADCKRSLFIVVFSPYSIVEVLIQQNKNAKLWNYAFQRNSQKQSPRGVM